MRDLLSLSCSEAVIARLNMMSSYVYKQAGAIGSLAITEPQKALEKARELQDEINYAFTELKVDLGCEHDRRNPPADEPIILPVPSKDDPSSACVGETTDQIAASLRKPKLNVFYDHDGFTEPVSSGIVGKPVPQSDRTGA